MSDSRSQPHPQPHLGNFGAAVASWQLDVQTEVKKTSTLPTAMFDACDPMLEARLCEAADAMFQFLLTQAMPARDDADPARLELESVSTGELAALLRRLGEAPAVPPPPLDGDGDGELLGILADACCSREPALREHAGRHLAQRFAVGADTDPLQLAAALVQQLQAVLPPASADGDRRLQRTCEQIAAAVLQVCLLPRPEAPL